MQRKWCRFDWHMVVLTPHRGGEARVAAMRPRMKLTRTDRRVIKSHWPFGRVVLIKGTHNDDVA